jgi:hypothetical protein
MNVFGGPHDDNNKLLDGVPIRGILPPGDKENHVNDLSLHADSICSNNNGNRDSMVEIKDLSESSRQGSKPPHLLQIPVRLPQALEARGLDDDEYCDRMLRAVLRDALTNFCDILEFEIF